MPKALKITSLHYLCNKERDEVERDGVDVLHADKHQTFLQVVSVNLGGMASHAQCTQYNKLAKSLQYLKKEVRNEVELLCRETSKFSTS